MREAHRRKERERACVQVCIGEKKRMKRERERERMSDSVGERQKTGDRERDQMDPAYSHPPFLAFTVYHNESQGLHNPAQLRSTHLITNGD